MRKLLSTAIGAVFFVSAVAQGADDWADVLKAFNYKSNGFSCRIMTDGSICNLKAGDALVVKKSLLHGKYEIAKGEKHDCRFFQGNEKNHPLKLRKTGENSYALEKTGSLSNEKHKPAASYTEKISLSPRAIEIEFEIELLVPLASQSGIFCSLNYLPLDTFQNRGFRFAGAGGKSKLMVFPQNYSKASALHLRQAKDIMVSLEKGIFEIAAGKGSVFSISDTRSYKGKAFRIDINEYVPWKHKAMEFPVGKQFKWSFKYIYKEHE